MSRGALWGVILAGGDGHAYVAQAAAIGRGPDRTVLLGIAPDRPAPGYGWIEPWAGRPDSGDTEDSQRYLDLGLLVIFFLLFPWLAHRFGTDSRNGIEADEYQRRRSHGT